MAWIKLEVGFVIVAVLVLLGGYGLRYLNNPPDILIPGDEQTQGSVPADIVAKANEHDPSARLVQIQADGAWTYYTYVGKDRFDIIIKDDKQPPLVNPSLNQDLTPFTTFKTLQQWTVTYDVARTIALQANIPLKDEDGSSRTLRHSPITQIHGGAEPPPHLVRPTNPYWMISEVNPDGAMNAKGLIVYVDAITGQVLFTTEYALK